MIYIKFNVRINMRPACGPGGQNEGVSDFGGIRDEEKKSRRFPVAAGLLAAAVLVGIGGFALNRYAPTGEHMDKMEYYGLTDESQAALVVDDQGAGEPWDR